MLAIIFLVESLNPRPPCRENLYSSNKHACLINTRQNTFIGPLNFTFLSNRSFKFFKYQICPSSCAFVSNISFKF
jgi:hypothetical protein